MDALFLNGIPVSDDGLTVREIEGWDDGPRWQLAEADAAERAGRVVDPTNPTVEPRTVVVRGLVRAADHGALLTALRTLRRRLYARPVELATGDDPDRYLVGYLEEFPVPPGAAQLVAREADIELRFRCPDPYRVSRQATAVALSSTPAQIPLGDAPIGGVLEIHGTASAPAVVYRDRAGTERGRLTFGSLALGADELLRLDFTDQTMTRVTAAGLADTTVWKTSGQWFVVTPQDGAEGAWPTLELTAGQGVFLYRRRWL